MPGMSGAPLLNLRGDLIGVQKEGLTANSRINFCIPQESLDVLDLTKKPRKFPGGVSLQDDFRAVGLRKQSLQRPELKLDGRVVDMGCRHWGYVQPPDADFVFNTYIGDRQRFSAIMPKIVVQDILRRHRVANITNSAFGFSFLVPDNYDFSETVQHSPPGLLITLVTRDSGVPAPFRNMQIKTTHMSTLTEGDSLSETIKEIVESFATNELQLEIHEATTRTPPRTERDVIMNGQMSDAAPRVDAARSLARYHVIFNSASRFNYSWSVYAVVAGDTATLSAYAFRTFMPVLGVAPDAAEHQFVAETVSFDAFDRQ
jgi:hypothetical protein